MIKQNRWSLLFSLVALALAIMLFSLPLYGFSATVYSKKSSNTFPGDEKYIAALKETQEKMAELSASGIPLEISEEQLLRETSKGQTSLMTFTLRQTVQKTAWDVMRSQLPPGAMLIAIASLLLLSFVLLILDSFGAMKSLQAPLHKGLRLLSCAAALCALILMPISVMHANYHFQRAIKLFSGGNDVTGVGALLPMWGQFLFATPESPILKTALGNLQFRFQPLGWLLLLPSFMMLLPAIQAARDRIRPTLLRGALYLSVLVLCILIVYPFFIMIITGFRTPNEATDMNFIHLLPSKWIWTNLSDIINRDVLRFLGNSVLLSTGATLLAMVCGIPAAYAMSRMQFRGKKAFLGFVIMSQMFSPVVLLVGISKLMNELGMSNSLWGLAFINAAFNQAFAIWLLRGVFVSISPEMEQAACIDGCSTVGALVRILLPMAAPGIVTSLIFVFINSWNEYTISTVLITNRLNKPITVGITEFSSYNMIEWHYLFAAAFLATIPVVILFMGIEKYLVSGLTSGGVKG